MWTVSPPATFCEILLFPDGRRLLTSSPRYPANWYPTWDRRSSYVATASELAEVTGLSRRAVLNHLRSMVEAGTIDAVGTARSPRRRYRWIGKVD